MILGCVTLWQLSQCHIFGKHEKLFGNQVWCFENVKWLFCDRCHTSNIVTSTDKWPQKIFWNATVWQLSGCHNFKKIFLLNFWFHKSINKVKRLLCDTCHKSRWFMALENEPKVIIWEGTVWQLSQCHTFLPWNGGVLPKIPKPLCSIVSVSISPIPMVSQK